jgi:hypothetical protein
MNEILAGIYGTGGIEKTASPTGEGPMTLSDLALAITAEQVGEEVEIEKVASVHDGVLGKLIEFDRAGRATAHAEFSSMEKAASEGDTEALESFFADMLPEEDAEEDVSTADLRAAVVAELQRREGAE